MAGSVPLYEIRQVLFWAMWLFLGIQIIFASFFLSMLGISRGTFIGDYDLTEISIMLASQCYGSALGLRGCRQVPPLLFSRPGTI